MGKNRPVQVNPPEKGSFPLDHFQECDDSAERYRKCLAKEGNFPKKCRLQAQEYLQCRMDKGLMSKVPVEELGFIPEGTWEYEKATKEEMAKKVEEIMRESKKRVREEYQKQHSTKQ